MLEINQFLNRETREFRRKTIKLNQDMKDARFEKTKKIIQEKYNEWLLDLQKLLNNKRYRQVLREIEEKKRLYHIIAKTEFWKLKILKAKAILKIINRKMQKHNKEIIIDNSYQNLSLIFWFNQIFITLEELVLEFRFDLNPHMDPNSKYILKSVQTVAEAHLEFIQYLCLFSIKVGEYMPLLSYISIAGRFIQYLNILTNQNIYDSLENIYLIKVKLLIQNCSYIAALDNLEIFFKFFFKNMKLVLDNETHISFKMLNSKEKNDKKKNIVLCSEIQNIIMAYYLRGIISENLGFYKNAIKAYQQCRWFSNIFMYNFNKAEFKYFRNMERIYIVYDDIFKDIQKQLDIKNKEKNQESKRRTQRIFYISKKSYLKNLLNNNNKNKIKQSEPITNVSRNKKVNKFSGLRRNKSVDSRMNITRLIKILDKIGYKLFKEEKSRNNNVFNKFGPNQYVLSTVDMVNDLLSQPFREVLTKMDKIEVTKPNEEIKYLINKTITIKKRNEFKEKFTTIEKIASSNKSKNKIHYSSRHRNKSLSFNDNTIQNMKFINNSVQQKFKLISKSAYNEKKTNENNRYETLSTNNIKANIFPHMKYLLQANKISIKSKNFKKINKYSPDKDVFSKKMQDKKDYLDSFFEKELSFQKRLLKLKSFDMSCMQSEDFNQQEVIKAADQDFKRIKCFAESKNAKKNLINLVGENQIKNWELMEKNKFRARATKKMNILTTNSINKFMKIYHINQVRPKFNPNDTAKINDEKEKKLIMECIKLDELQNKCKIQKEILRNKYLGIKPKKVNNTNNYNL